jgi:peptidyl-prolyl cis-trans isomerase B (cyclophilin B)
MLSRPLAALATVAALALTASCSSEDPETATDTSSPSESSTESTTETPTEEAPGTDVECDYPSDGRPAAKEVEPPPAEATVSGTVEVTIATGIGDLHAQLDADATPCTVGSFVSLAEQGFYDGTSCHRMTTTPNFEVLQCGDPTGTGSGGPGYTIPDELTGDETYSAGTLAMANTGMPNSGGSQFFIVYGDTALPPDYAVFGTVDQGTIDLIAEAAKAGVTPGMGPEDGAPKTPIDFETVTVD